MNCLLDTHALLWTLFDPARLGPKAVDSIRNPDLAISVSVVSFWEISLKYATGKLELSGVIPDDFPTIVRQSGFDILPIAETDAATFHHLPRMEHKDRPSDYLAGHFPQADPYLSRPRLCRLSKTRPEGTVVTLFAGRSTAHFQALPE